MSANDGGPAFPNKDELGNMITGMSLRDWFAGQALVGWGSGRMPGAMEVANPDEVARLCYAYADAMLRARNLDKQ